MQDTIRARRIDLVDDQGNIRLSLSGSGPGEEENPYIRMRGPEVPTSGVSIWLSGDDATPRIKLTNADGSSIAFAFTRGRAFLRMIDEDGTALDLSPKQEPV